MTIKKIEGKFFGIEVCINCSHKLSHNDEYYSGGVCPYCGNLTIGTRCNTETVVIKEIKYIENLPWWRFRTKEIQIQYVSKNNKSLRWLKKALSNNWIRQTNYEILIHTPPTTRGSQFF